MGLVWSFVVHNVGTVRQKGNKTMMGQEAVVALFCTKWKILSSKLNWIHSIMTKPSKKQCLICIQNLYSVCENTKPFFFIKTDIKTAVIHGRM